MAKYIDLESLVNWLKHIPLKDLSYGQGMCRVIMEDDFKAAISSLPESTFVDMVPVVRCKDCVYSRELTLNEKRVYFQGVVICTNQEVTDGIECGRFGSDFCSEGVRKEAPNGGDTD